MFDPDSTSPSSSSTSSPLRTDGAAYQSAAEGQTGLHDVSGPTVKVWHAFLLTALLSVFAGAFSFFGANQQLSSTQAQGGGFSPPVLEDAAPAVIANDTVMTIPILYEEGWNMVSAPLTMDDPQYQSIFPRATQGLLLGYGGEYRQEEFMAPGRGYWLHFSDDDDARITFRGGQIRRHALPLVEGWNIIGGLSCPVSSDGIADPDGILAAGSLFTRQGSGYTAATYIEPGIGYWLMTEKEGTVTLDCDKNMEDTVARTKMESSAALTPPAFPSLP